MEKRFSFGATIGVPEVSYSSGAHHGGRAFQGSGNGKIVPVVLPFLFGQRGIFGKVNSGDNRRVMVV